MLCIQSKTDDIFFNLATEEYLLRNTMEDYMMLWRSMPVVVVGKHQNALAEINPEFIRKHQINVARRLTGGGAVYHDKGNLNFTFIITGEKNKLIDFKRFVSPVVEFIHHKGVPVVIGKRNDILINGKKISGNAEHVFKKRILHHGTLLYNSDLEMMYNALYSLPSKFKDKSIQSNRTAVTNLMEFMKDGQQIENFVAEFYRFICDFFKNSFKYDLNEREILEIQKLRDE